MFQRGFTCTEAAAPAAVVDEEREPLLFMYEPATPKKSNRLSSDTATTTAAHLMTLRPFVRLFIILAAAIALSYYHVQILCSIRFV